MVTTVLRVINELNCKGVKYCINHFSRREALVITNAIVGLILRCIYYILFARFCILDIVYGYIKFMLILTRFLSELLL